MKRVIRRQLRIWYSDISGYWGRFRTFHRVALGIIFAIVIIFVARKYWLDPIRAEVMDLTDKYEKSEPPNPLPTIENDEDITLANEQIISREKSTETKKREMETVAKSRPKITQQNKEAVLSEFASIISRNKLELILSGIIETNNPASANSPKQTTPKTSATKPASPATKNNAQKTKTNTAKTATSKTAAKNQPAETNKTTAQNIEQPLKTEEYIYYLEGDFGNIFNFLKQIESFSYPIKITKFYLGTEGQAVNGLLSNSRQEKLQLRFNLVLYFHN
ncbi:MAG: hypothetical protein LBL39_06580 [Planctomycetaceae bacterium]|jgi:hypothetical protein|nr:hypothetical protein [Planctomycetaceae bacterium]